ncbi:MAG: hypothetical protein IIY33_06665 [Erysipelotrichaceae bacterium]|nr:hypothetical protein [Erysipelotrichaceae bacterium]
MSLFDKIFSNSYSSQENEYSSLSDSELRSFFSSEKWPSDVNERRKILSEVSNRYCTSRGLDGSAKIMLTDSADYYGAYSKGRICLSTRYMDNPYQALDTVIHETNHFCQDKGIGYNDYEKVLLKAELSRTGYGKYEDDEDYYDVQDVEMDSNNAAFEYVTSFHEEFKNDPRYQEYLEDRYDHFNGIQSMIDEDKEYWQKEEADHILNAHENGEIDNVDVIVGRTMVTNDDRFKNSFQENAEKSEQLLDSLEEEHVSENRDENDNVESNENADLEIVELGDNQTVSNDNTDENKNVNDENDNLEILEFDTDHADESQDVQKKRSNEENTNQNQVINETRSEEQRGITSESNLNMDLNENTNEDRAINPKFHPINSNDEKGENVIEEGNDPQQEVNTDQNEARVTNPKFHPINNDNDDEDDSEEGNNPQKVLVLSRDGQNQVNEDEDEEDQVIESTPQQVYTAETESNDDIDQQDYKDELLSEDEETQGQEETNEYSDSLLNDDEQNVSNENSDYESLINDDTDEESNDITDEDWETLFRDLNDSEEEAVNDEKNSLLNDQESSEEYEQNDDYNQSLMDYDSNDNDYGYQESEDLEMDDSEEMGMSR